MDLHSAFGLADRTIMVTGASSGIGAATAAAAAAFGARVVAVGRNQEALDAVIGGLPGQGHSAIVADLAAPSSVDELVNDAPIHGLAHFAGQDLMRPLARLTAEGMAAVYQLHVVAAAMLVKKLVQRKEAEDELAVVLASSVSAFRGQPGLMGYSAAKAALDGMVRTMAVELAPRRVRANMLVIGHVAGTQMSNRTAKVLPSEAHDRLRLKHPLGFGDPSDPAMAACFLMSPAARWVTGASLSVDGGFNAG